MWIPVAFAGARRRPLSREPFRRMPCPPRARKAGGGLLGLRLCMGHSKQNGWGAVCAMDLQIPETAQVHLKRLCLQDDKAAHMWLTKNKWAGPLALRPILPRQAFVLISLLYRAIKA